MEEQLKDNNNTDADSTSSMYPEKKADLPYGALILSLVPVIYICLGILTEGLFIIVSILIFPIILLVLIAPIIGLSMGLVFIGSKKGSTAGEIMAVSAIVLPILELMFTIIYFSNVATSITFSM